ALQKFVEDPLSDALIQGQLAEVSLIEIFLDNNALGIRPLLGEEELPSVRKVGEPDKVLVH
ncbi:MAG: hypothetical protein AAB401_24140, partial [Acidobacteriota bacterium]